MNGDGDPVSEGLCVPTTKPAETKPCNGSCDSYHWTAGNWSKVKEESKDGYMVDNILHFSAM